MQETNLIVSYRWGNFGKAKGEIKRLLRGFGDERPKVEKTCAMGICRVSTAIDAREVIKRIRALHKENPEYIRHAIKWIPADGWTSSEIPEMKKLLESLKGNIREGEAWAMKVEKRRYTRHHKAEIIKELADLIPERVDLRNPDKIVLVEIIGNDACISVLKPEEVFSAP